MPLEEFGFGEPVEVVEEVDEGQDTEDGPGSGAGEDGGVRVEVAAKQMDQVAVEVSEACFGAEPVAAGGGVGGVDVE